MIYGYARCSTNEMLQDIDRQKRELKEKNVLEKNIYWEYQSGTKENRIQLKRLLDVLKEGDVIITTEVSRITRSTKQLCEIIELAKVKRIKLIFGNFILDCTERLEPMTEGMLKMMGVFAELERNMISERVKSGIQNAKAKGKKIGRPRTTEKNIPNQFFKYYVKYINKEINKKELSRLCNLSYPSIFKYIGIVQVK